jgi:hypothetical protein
MGWASLLIVTLAQSASLQDGVTAQLAFHRGLQQRADGHPAEAVSAFRMAAERLESDSLPPSSALSFKAGNAWFLAGDLPHAIAAYHRGSALDPSDETLRTVLEYARDQVQYSPVPDIARQLRPEREFWPTWLTLGSVGGYAFGTYYAACLAATRWRMTRRRRWLIAAVTLLVVALIPVAGTGFEWLRSRRGATEPIVVVTRDIPLRIGNGADYLPKLDVPRGCEVRQLFERGGWIQVQTGGGLVGWLPADQVVRR